MPRGLGVFHQLGVAARRLGRVTRERVAGSRPRGHDPEASEEALRAAFRDVEAGAVPALRAVSLHRLPADRPPWLDTGLVLEAGESATWIAAGRVVLSRLLDVFVEPHFQLWGRLGDGPVFSGTRATHSFHAQRSGRLFLASYFPGEWADPSGRLRTSLGEYRSVSGGMSVVLLRWRGDPLEGLRELRARTGASPWLDLEIDRLERSVRTPEGWRYLWFLGDAEIFRREDGAEPSGAAPEIRCRTKGDVGILQKEVDVPLEPETTLAWAWRVDALPSSVAEDTLPTHDYLSIAVEFENGRDLTYCWSAELPEGRGYWCPLPTWRDREFHVVVRSGADELGGWLAEERRVHEDYRRYVGEPPARVRRVWLIANSLFQRGEGRCAYRSIGLRSGMQHTAVL